MASGVISQVLYATLAPVSTMSDEPPVVAPSKSLIRVIGQVIGTE